VKRNKVFLLGCLVALIACGSKAQGTLNALTIPSIYPPSAPVIGFVTSGGIGWSFVPTSDIFVTGIEASAPQLSFWQGSNQVLATFGVPVPSTPPADSFSPIAPLFLSAGQLYFVSCQTSNFSGFVGLTVWGLQGASSLPSFSTSSYISQFASYHVSASGQWSPATDLPLSNSDYLLYGPNFQFQVVPEPGITGLSILGLLFCSKRQSCRTIKILRPDIKA